MSSGADLPGSGGPAGRPGRRVLMSAFACQPGHGSELGAGWAWARAAAQHADVVLLTERRYGPAIHAELKARPAPSLRPVFVDLPPVAAGVTRSDRLIRARHALWQRAAHDVALRLHEEDSFDLVHHVTWSADWQPVGVAGLGGLPFVWGPVGGACPTPWTLRRYLSTRSALGELARASSGGLGRRVYGDRAAAHATVVLCQNEHVAERFRRHTSGRVVVEPNVAVAPGWSTTPPARVGSRRRAVFAGRLQDWKGVRLAVDALSRPEACDWDLEMLGDGPAREGLQQLVTQKGLTDRVSFRGHQPHAEVLAVLARADALLFPSMHEGCGWVVAEALSVGCPPVCLDVGGPPVLVRRAGFGTCVPVTSDPAPALARALRDLPQPRPAPSDAFSSDRLPALIASYYDEAVARGVVGVP